MKKQNNLESMAREALALAEKAIKPPWNWHKEMFGWKSLSTDRIIEGNELCHVIYSRNDGLMGINHSDANFIAQSRTMLPALAQGYLDLLAENKEVGFLNKILRNKIADWESGVELNKLYIRKNEEIAQLKSENEILKALTNESEISLITKNRKLIDALKTLGETTVEWYPDDLQKYVKAELSKLGVV